MRTLPLHIVHNGIWHHQKNWGAALAEGWRGQCLRWARHSQRKILRDLADDPHLLADIGVTREQALEEAGRWFFDLTDVQLHRITEKG